MKKQREGRGNTADTNPVTMDDAYTIKNALFDKLCYLLHTPRAVRVPKNVKQIRVF